MGKQKVGKVLRKIEYQEKMECEKKEREVWKRDNNGSVII